MNKTEKSGAIILNKDCNKILLLFRGNRGDFNDWTFPKGHIEENENKLEAMTREVKEETGLDVDIIKVLPNLEYVTDKNEKCIVYFYLVKSKNDLYLKLEHKEDFLEWVYIEDVINKLSYNNLKEYFKLVKDLIKS